MTPPNQSKDQNKARNLGVHAERKTYYAIHFHSDFFEGRDIQCIQELSKASIEVHQATELSVAYSLQNIDVVSFVKFRHRISEHSYTKGKLERNDFSFKASFRNREKLRL